MTAWVCDDAAGTCFNGGYISTKGTTVSVWCVSTSRPPVGQSGWEAIGRPKARRWKSDYPSAADLLCLEFFSRNSNQYSRFLRI